MANVLTIQNSRYQVYIVFGVFNFCMMIHSFLMFPVRLVPPFLSFFPLLTNSLNRKLLARRSKTRRRCLPIQTESNTLAHPPGRRRSHTKRHRGLSVVTSSRISWARCPSIMRRRRSEELHGMYRDVKSESDIGRIKLLSSCLYIIVRPQFIQAVQRWPCHYHSGS